MKLMLSLLASLLFTSIGHAQPFKKVSECVIENGKLKTVIKDYDPATGNSYITVNGSQHSFDQLYPNIGEEYAMSTSWFAATSNLTVDGQKYSKYGYPRILGVQDVVRWAAYKKIGIYVESGTKEAPEVIYIPTRRGCEFQPYAVVRETTKQKKIYYDADWIVTNDTSYAAYYRLVTLDATGKPVGQVRDFYITGEKQWEGTLSYLDPYYNRKDIVEGYSVWFHKNGKKAAEVKRVQGKYDGAYKSWTDKGTKESEIEYSNGVLNGSFKTWFPNGKPAMVAQYVNGQLNGKQVSYLEDGRVSYQETYVLGKPSKPCFELLDSRGSMYQVCTDLFSKTKKLFTWKYTGSTGVKHSVEEAKGLQVKSLAGAKAIAFFDHPADPKAVQSISTEFTVTSEDESAEYGLIWNFVDTANFNYFIMSNGGEWSAGSFRKGERYGLEYNGVEKRGSGEYWNHGSQTQSIRVTLNPDGVELWLNDNAIYSVYSPNGVYGFKQKGMGVISLGKANVYFNKFGTTYQTK